METTLVRLHPALGAMANNSVAAFAAFVMTGALAVTGAFGQKPWVATATFGPAASEMAVHPGLDLVDILPAGMTSNISAWDWLTDDKVVFTNWIWNFTTKPLSEIWVLEGMKAQDKSRITLKRFYPGNLREPLGVKVVNGEVYAVVKFALLKFVDADKDGIAEDTVKIVDFPHKLEPSETWNHYSMDLKYRNGFFYLALPSETVGGGYPHYPVLPGRGTVAKIDPVKKTLEYLVTGLRTPDGLGWGPDSSLFVTDNQGAWLPSSKLIHVTGKRFFGLQPVEAGDPSLVESPPAIWMPHGEGSSSPTQPMLLEKGPFAGQFLIGDNVLGLVNRVALDKVKGEYQGALFHFTGGVTCGVHRLLQNAAGDVYFGGLGSPINSWNVKGHYFGMQVARFNGKAGFEVKEILSRADGFTLRFSSPVGPSGEDPAHYRLRHWRYQATKEYGGAKLDNTLLTVGAVKVDPTRTLVHLAVAGLQPGRVVDFQFHRELLSTDARPIWTGQAWYTLNRISDEAGIPTDIHVRTTRPAGAPGAVMIARTRDGYSLRLPAGDFTVAEIIRPDGRTARLPRPANLDGSGTLFLDRGTIRPGVHALVLRDKSGARWTQRVVF